MTFDMDAAVRARDHWLRASLSLCAVLSSLAHADLAHADGVLNTAGTVVAETDAVQASTSAASGVGIGVGSVTAGTAASASTAGTAAAASATVATPTGNATVHAGAVTQPTVTEPAASVAVAAEAEVAGTALAVAAPVATPSVSPPKTPTPRAGAPANRPARTSATRRPRQARADAKGATTSARRTSSLVRAERADHRDSNERPARALVLFEKPAPALALFAADDSNPPSRDDWGVAGTRDDPPSSFGTHEASATAPGTGATVVALALALFLLAAASAPLPLRVRARFPTPRSSTPLERPG